MNPTSHESTSASTSASRSASPSASQSGGTCAIDGCTELTRRWHRLCPTHERRKCRGATGAALRAPIRERLDPWQRYLEAAIAYADAIEDAIEDAEERAEKRLFAAAKAWAESEAASESQSSDSTPPVVEPPDLVGVASDYAEAESDEEYALATEGLRMAARALRGRASTEAHEATASDLRPQSQPRSQSPAFEPGPEPHPAPESHPSPLMAPTAEPHAALYLTPDELVARYRGVIARATLDCWRSTGGGPAFVKLGNRVLYLLTDVEAWEASRKMARGCNTQGLNAQGGAADAR